MEEFDGNPRDRRRSGSGHPTGPETRGREEGRTGGRARAGGRG